MNYNPKPAHVITKLKKHKLEFIKSRYVDEQSTVHYKCSICDDHSKSRTWASIHNSLRVRKKEFGTKLHKGYNPSCSNCFDKITNEQKLHSLSIFVEENFSGKLISTSYTRIKDSYEFQCKFEKHPSFSKTEDYLRRTHSWCPLCLGNFFFGEEVTRFYLESIFKTKFHKSYPNWLVNRDGNRMELDGYNEILKIAFEHHGQQHYKPTNRGKTPQKTFEEIQDRDMQKIELCRKKGIKLLIIPSIPYMTKIPEVHTVISKELKRLKIKVDANLRDLSLNHIWSKNPLDELKIYAKLRGGKLISKNYYGKNPRYLFKCKNNSHREFGKLFREIINEKWCPTCSKDEQNLKQSKTAYDQLVLHLEADNFKVITKFKNCTKKEDNLIVMCPQGHKIKVKPRRYFQRKTKDKEYCCPICINLILPFIKIENIKYEIRNFIKYRTINIKETQLQTIISVNEVLDIQFNGKKDLPVTLNKIVKKLRSGELFKDEKDLLDRPIKLEEVRNIAIEKYGWKLKSTEYIGANKVLIFKCPAGHDVEERPARITDGSAACKKCSIIKRDEERRVNTANDKLEKYKAFKASFIPELFISAKTNTKLKCKKCNNEWDQWLSNADTRITNKGYLCPKCKYVPETKS